MTQHTDILGRYPRVRQYHPQLDEAPYERQPFEAWSGESLIRAPKREPDPEPQPAKMHFTERREIVAKMHADGRTVQDIMADLSIPRETIAKDFKALGIDIPTPQCGVMKGSEERARKAFSDFAKKRRVAQKEIRNTRDTRPEAAALRLDCVAAIHKASGASAALVAQVTGIKKATVAKMLNKARGRE